MTWSEKKWKTVHFSDESKFNLFDESDGRRYVRQGVGETSSVEEAS